MVGKLNFHSRNQDIIKVLVSWKRNEISLLFSPKRSRNEISNIMSFNVTSSLTLSYSSRSGNKIPQGIKVAKDSERWGKQEVKCSWSFFNLATSNPAFAMRKSRRNSLTSIKRRSYLLTSLPFLFYLFLSHLPLR